MKYLVSVPPEQVSDDDKDRWAPGGELVIPWFPAPPQNLFLCVPSFKFAPYAVVKDVSDFDPDVLAAQLKKQYPGLPDKLHENYVLETARIALRFPVGTRFQPFIDINSVKLRVVGTESMNTLWEKQPM